MPNPHNPLPPRLIPGLLFSLLLSLLLSGCGNDSTPNQTTLDSARRALPQDPELAAVYQRSCRSCHAEGTAAAPLTGDTAAWAPRLEKGMDTLVDNAINGFGGMPPFGLCMDCQPEEFEALIRFMASPL